MINSIGTKIMFVEAMSVTNNLIPVKLNCVLAVNANEIQSTDFLVVTKLNYYFYF